VSDVAALLPEDASPIAETPAAAAESLGRRSLRILEAALGPDDAEVGLTLLNLAAAVAEQGRQAEAAELTARAVAILTTRLPPDHPHVLAADQALARLASAP
jgi:hypothetical protein